MYQPEHFQERDSARIVELIDRNPLAALVTFREGELDANHIPLFRESAVAAPLVLVGHVSRNNPVWNQSAQGGAILAIFRGADGYISPHWYPGKAQDENQVPTWNYQVVHVRGELEFLDDAKFVRGVVARLVTKHEQGQPKPWKMTDSEPHYIDEMLKGIVGVRIRATSVEAKFKLSQNRDHQDREGAAKGVRESGNTGVSLAMRDE